MERPIAEAGGRRWSELEIKEHANGELMFPADLRRRGRTGEVKTTKVYVRIPGPIEHMMARSTARAAITKLKADDGAPLDETRDKDLFEQLEQLCVLSLALRTFQEPHGQLEKWDALAVYDEGCLKDIQEQINAFKAEQDPGDAVLTDEDVWRKLVAIAREAHIGPLVGTAGPAQHICIVRAAQEACRSPAGRRWLQSFGISIPDSSPSESSGES